MKSKFSLSITEAFKDRKFKYSGTATLLVISVVVVTLIINLLCGLVPLKLDITATKLFSISQKTVSILNNLEDDINIYFIYQVGAEDDYIMELADRYVAASNKIHTELIDPISNPGFTNMFAMDDNKSSTVPQIGSVVVECETTGMFVTLTSSNFYTQQTSDSGVTTTYYEGEEAFTNAISAVTTDLSYEIAVLEGHNEDEIPEVMMSMLKKRFFKVTTVNLKEEKQLPIGTSVLLILAPEYDITKEEKDIILDFLDPKDSAGSLIYVAGKAIGKTPYLDELMAHYCVTLSDKVIYEEEPKNITVDAIKYSLQLNYTRNSTTVTNYVDQRVWLTNAKPIFTNMDLARQTVVYADIAYTSNKAWASDKKKEGTLEYSATDGDILTDKGFVPILAIEEYSDSLGTKKSKVLVVNCENFLVENEAALTSFANDEIFYSSLFWAIGDDAAQITLSPKYYLVATHSLSMFQVYIFGIVLGVIIPLAILGGGLAVYLKRRHL